MKKNHADYHAAGKLCNLKWLGNEIIDANTKTLWQCLICNHVFSTKYGHIQQGHGCAECGHKRTQDKQRFKPAKYHALAKKCGYKWLGPEVKNCFVKTQWQCHLQHKWWTDYHHIQQGGICRQCGITSGVIKIKLTAGDYHAMAELRRIKWIGDKIVGSGIDTPWHCDHHGEFRACYERLQQGQGCPKCGHERGASKQRHPASKYEELAVKRDIYWLGPIAKSIISKTKWQCKQGHLEWKATYSAIKRGMNCPSCEHEYRSTRQRLKEDSYHILATKRNMLWLGPAVANANLPTQWQCEKCIFKWWQKYAHIYTGSGCPKCAAGVGQRALYERVKKLLPKDEEIGFDKRVSFLGKQHFDIYVPARKIAIEYHGRQHYEPVSAYGGVLALEQTRARDNRKREICAREKIILLEVPFFRANKITNKQLLLFLNNPSKRPF